ncbi:MAG: prepilin-type N-terminal cleavage/methylation domain-containing protein [Patescibacteria group bacterium]|nr:prepilin-type N-terminal cleavage/methylation domain-containing protein [Patescibacteria group bacterium]
MKSKKGFTLIEVIIYIALFSLLMGTALVAAYQLIDGSGKLSTKNTTQEEGNFVMRKIDWALTGVQSITTPSSGTTNNLVVNKYDGNTITIDLTGTNPKKIEIKESTNGNAFLPIITDNVSISNLQFTYLAPTGSAPIGITATFTITKDGVDFPFTITKYIRK